MKIKCLYLISFIFIQYKILAQVYHEDVFPNFNGLELSQALKDEYTPDAVIDYNFARDTLYLKIDAVDRNLSCIYTGLTLFIPEGSDPTQAVFLNGENNGINAEHVFPQAYFVDNTTPVSDMHNLYPSKVKTNNDRANYPFDEISDNATDIWYRNSNELNSIPTTNIDEYSEFYRNGANSTFEPREKVKGDIARSMFYIHSIYSNTQYAEPLLDDYFVSQRETLCNWHFQDPVDEVEWTRTQKISAYQGNKNPFVLDCSVAQRLYCGSHTEMCKPVSTVDESNQKLELFTYDFITCELKILQSIKGRISITSMSGVNITTYIIDDSIPSIVSLKNLVKGNYVVRLTTSEISQSQLVQVR